MIVTAKHSVFSECHSGKNVNHRCVLLIPFSSSLQAGEKMAVVAPSTQRPFALANRTKLVNLHRYIFHSLYFEFCMYVAVTPKMCRLCRACNEDIKHDALSPFSPSC